jgi:hypothetical protein
MKPAASRRNRRTCIAGSPALNWSFSIRIALVLWQLRSPFGPSCSSSYRHEPQKIAPPLLSTTRCHASPPSSRQANAAANRVGDAEIPELGVEVLPAEPSAMRVTPPVRPSNFVAPPKVAACVSTRRSKNLHKPGTYSGGTRTSGFTRSGRPGLPESATQTPTQMRECTMR